MHQRKDGIVDFDSASCIGCKACLEACPYDAIYVDPDKGTAAKCHYCAHRTERGLEPACAAACPAHAIVAGDLDDPEGELARLVESQPVRVRRPEQGTNPKVFYVAAEDCTIEPHIAHNVGTYMWATSNSQRNRVLRMRQQSPKSGSPLVAYDVEHERPWDWQVPVYFFTKSIASGALLVPAACAALLGTAFNAALGLSLSAIGLAFMLATLLLLVSDLSRRERFLAVLTSPQPRSWLARGAFLLVLYSALLTVHGASNFFHLPSLATALVWPTVIGGALSAVYTAFLCAQCAGCDHFQSPLLPLHLLVQCWIASAAMTCLVPVSLGGTDELRAAACLCLLGGLVLHLAISLFELFLPHATPNARHAIRLLTRGPLRGLHLGVGLGLGILVPLMTLALLREDPAAIFVSSALSLLGLLAFEWCFVMAGQSAPNS
jgi:formate-dependent nitrite reductase membrane component NrfD/ferredoxin